MSRNGDGSEVRVVEYLDDLDHSLDVVEIPCPSCTGEEEVGRPTDSAQRFVCLECLGDGTVRVLALDVE
jgi:hypothetical protein